MKFVDKLKIKIVAGHGGNGCMSFLRERFKPNGGPDGGNGGHGGSVWFTATNNLQTLADLEYMHHIKGNNGGHGKGAQRNGAKGEDINILVPCGTIIYDDKTNEGLADLTENGDTFMAARGGKGGRGNRYFASSCRKTPRFCEQGRPGEEIAVRIELKLIADIGLVGLPNVGKSSILASISSAQPKIANYPFTTLSPNLGVLNTDEEKIIIADIPGLIEGAHINKGLGLEFLRHIDRTRLLLHVLSLESGRFDEIIKNYEIVNSELAEYDVRLSERPTLIVLNKSDEVDEVVLPELIAKLTEYFKTKGFNTVVTSALTDEGIEFLTKELVKFTKIHPRPQSQVKLFAWENRDYEKDPVRKRTKIQVIALHGGGYQILHSQLEDAAVKYDFTQEENVARFTRLLRKYKVEELLERAGAVAGDTIRIAHKEFVFYPDFYPNSEFEDEETDSDNFVVKDE